MFIILSCLFPVSNKAEAAEVDPLLESQSDGGTLMGSSQISAPEDYWFFANRVTMMDKAIHKRNHSLVVNTFY